LRHWNQGKGSLALSAISLCCLGLYPIVAGAANIIVNDLVPSVRCSRAETRAIFAMRQRLWTNGEQIKVFTLADDNPVHKDFVRNNLNMFPHQFRRAWDRMTYTGTGVAPIQLDSEQEMIKKIMNTPNAIGYVSKKPDNAKIRLFDCQ